MHKSLRCLSTAHRLLRLATYAQNEQACTQGATCANHHFAIEHTRERRKGPISLTHTLLYHILHLVVVLPLVGQW
jgi:hypothetical protein